MIENVQTESPKWENLAKFGFLAVSAAPWTLIGAALLNARKSPSEMWGFSGYVSNPSALPTSAGGVPTVGTDKGQYYAGQTIDWTAINLDPTRSYVVGVENGRQPAHRFFMFATQGISGESTTNGQYQTSADMVGATRFGLFDLTGMVYVAYADVSIVAVPVP